MREPVTTTVSTLPCCCALAAVMPIAAADAAPRSRAERRLRVFWLVLNTWNPLGSVGNDDYCPRASARCPFDSEAKRAERPRSKAILHLGAVPAGSVAFVHHLVHSVVRSGRLVRITALDPGSPTRESDGAACAGSRLANFPSTSARRIEEGGRIPFGVAKARGCHDDRAFY